MGKVWNWLHAKDWRTWVGHGLQGFVIVWVADLTGLGVGAGVFATAVHFGLRELPGIIKAARGDTPKFIDGVFDLLAPFFGVALWSLLLGG